MSTDASLSPREPSPEPSSEEEPSEGEEAASASEQEAEEAVSAAPPAAAAAAGASERPASRASASASETASETDFTALRQRAPGAPPLKGPAPEGAPEKALPSIQELEASPWVDLRHPVTLYEGTKLVLMAPVVLFKLLLLVVAVVYAWAVLALMLLGHKRQAPMSPFRQFLVRQWVYTWGRFLLFLSGFYRIPVRGWRNMREAAACRAILIFNHPSYVDAAAIATFFQPSGVSKAGVASIPFIGLFGIALQLFFIERRGSSDRSNKHVLRGDAVQAIAERAADRRFPLLALAPEATTKAQPCLLQFRRGAFVAGQPVCPVLLRYTYRHFNPSWGIGPTLFHVYRLLAQFVNHLEIEVLPPYRPSEAELADSKLYAENVRHLMGERLGQPLVEQGLAEERQLWRWGVSVNWRGTRVVVPQRGRSKAD